MSVEIIYEDDFCLVVTKPNDVVVHHAYHSRNVREEDSLLQLLDQQFQQKFYPVHRLDRRTSGIIILTKETQYVAKFQQLFTDNQIQKKYLGVVRGFAPETRVIDSPVKGKDSNVHKEAETHLKTLQNITLNIPVKPYDTSRYSLVELSPKTGRLHQLRIHMNKISHPLLGDGKYGDKNHNAMFENNFDWSNLFLHAISLEFVHPFTEEKLYLKSSLPKNWRTLFKEFSWSYT
ncbi:pseudouridine synthase [Tenacibaculum jejuense]|uniref:Pseudouridine synthase n=1 Tax=Tenacibaculum jejuense TaxID=584609 RepID=A0A238U9A6_9FLAO|nr:pseudouridine synthase [Tenacibaculum jejuense]SNR15757.1 Pseudouridine synthase [Tenacibaculum jejuense]